MIKQGEDGFDQNTPESFEQELEVVSSAQPVRSQPGIVWVAREKIHRDPNQSRRYFDPDELNNMAASMKAVGIIDPLSVRPRSGIDEYDLLAGEKRHRSAEIAKIDQVPVRIFEVEDRVAEDIKAISNLQRSDLNKWEETNAIMGMLCRNLDKSSTEVISLLNQAANQKRGLTTNVVRNQDWEIVEEVFALVGRLSPESFRKHRVPLLKLPESVQQVLQQGKLHYTKVNEILKVKNPNQQSSLLKEAIAANLSVDQIQAKVKMLRQGSKPEPVLSSLPVSRQLTYLTRQLTQAKVWEDPQKGKKLQILLAQMEQLLE